VVNIDNGVGAAVAAVRMARLAAHGAVLHEGRRSDARSSGEP